MLEFLKPTRKKIHTTLIVLVAILIASSISDVFKEKLFLDSVLATDFDLLLKAFEERFVGDPDLFLIPLIKALVATVLTYIAVIYLAICAVVNLRDPELDKPHF
ncbi:MAG: hypothetical protein Q8P93_01800 [bacterium]|nr:hypothetical protein [bacterium]